MFDKSAIMVVFLFLVAAAAFMPVADAQAESQEYCTNSTHRYWESNTYFNGTLFSFNNTKNCAYGCLLGQCLPAPTESHDMALVVGIMMVAFFFIYAGLKMDKETHGVIQVLFMFVGVLFVIINLAVLSELADYSGISPLESAVDSGYNLAIYVFWFLLFYFIVLFFYKVLVGLGKMQPIKWSL